MISKINIGGIKMAIQDRFKRTNTVYKITQDIDLGGGTLTIPEGCTLDFQGGSFTNGTLAINNAKVISSNKCFSTSVKLSNDKLYIDASWFGLSPSNDSITNRDILECIFSQGGNNQDMIVYIPKGEYKTYGIQMSSSKVVNLYGDGMNDTYLRLDENDAESLYLLNFNCSYGRISNISFRGNTYNWSKGVKFTNTNTNLFALLNVVGFSNKIENASFRGSPNHGAYLNGCNNTKFVNCEFLYNWGYGAFNMFVRGSQYLNCWFELNYMGGVMHFKPYSNNSYNPSDCVLVKGSVTENNGVYGIKGDVKNYKGEDIENIGAYVTLCNTSGDIIKTEATYNGSNSKIQVLIKPLKRKYYTLTSNGILSFKDSSFNDFVVYKRGNSFGFSFDKEFLAGDTIYLYDFQQDCDITNNSNIQWKDEVLYEINTNLINYLEFSGLYQRVLIEEGSPSNFILKGAMLQVTDNRSDKFNYYDSYVERGLGKLIYNFLSQRANDGNIMFPSKKEDSNTILNPSLNTNTLDEGVIYCYIIVKGNTTALATLYGYNSVSSTLETLNQEVTMLDGFTVIEYVVDITNKNYSRLQWDITSNLPVTGYGAILSNVRFPHLPENTIMGNTDNRPSLNANGVGYQYFDTTLNRYVSWNGTQWSDSMGFPANLTKGTTAQRPTLTNRDSGYQYFDTQLGKYIVWNGSAWVNMDGTSLDVSSLNSMEVIPASEDKIN